MRIKIQGINLLPKEYIVAEQVRFYQKIGALVLALWTVCFIAFIVLPPKQEVVRTRDLLLQKQQEVNSSRYAGVNKTLSDLEQAKSDMQALINNYNSLKQDNAVSGETLDTLISRVPNGITIMTMSVTAAPGNGAKQMSIQYNADTYRIGQNYATILELIFPSAQKSIQYSYNQSLDIYNYTISINVPEEVVSEPVAETPAEGAVEIPAASDGEGEAN